MLTAERPVTATAPTLAQRIGARIRTARESRGLSQAALGELVPGADQSVVSLWESGARMPTAPGLIGLSTALGVSADYLLGLAEE